MKRKIRQDYKYIEREDNCIDLSGGGGDEGDRHLDIRARRVVLTL